MGRIRSVIATVALAVLAFGSVPTAANASADCGTIEFKSVDEAGDLLPGGAYAGLSCTRFNNDPDWTCIDLNEYEWFQRTNDAPSFDSLRKSGVSNKFTRVMDMEGTWAEPSQHCIVLQQTYAPAGYVGSTEPMAACAGPGGWTAENAQAAGFTYTMPDGQVASGDGGWTATNTEVDGVKSTVLQIVNKVGTSPIEPTPAEIPLTDDSGPRIGYVVFRKVDELGNLLPGGHFVGESCTRRDGEQNWQCESLNDYSWFEREPMADDYGDTPPSLFTAGAADQFHVDIPMRASTWGPNAPIEHCIHIAETEAPAGYEIQPGMTTVCLGPGGWTVENAIAAGWEDPTGDWTVTNSHTVVNLSTTLTLVNPKIETEEPTPTTPTETVVPVPPAGGGTPTATPVETTKPVAAGNLAATGAGEFVPIGLAGAAILAPSALILLRRRASE